MSCRPCDFEPAAFPDGTPRWLFNRSPGPAYPGPRARVHAWVERAVDSSGVARQPTVADCVASERFRC